MNPQPTPPETWLQNPTACAIGTIWMAGMLCDESTIPVDKMRILGRSALVLILSGEGYYRDGLGRARDLGPGDALLVTPDLAHAYGGKDGQTWGQAYVVFTGPIFDQLQQSPVYRAHQPVWHLEPVELWKRRLQDLLQPRRGPDPIEALRTVGRFSQLLIEMATTDGAARRRPEDAWLEQSLHLLGEAHPEGWISPADVAEQVGLSYETFRKRFRERIGQAPGQFQQKRRIDQACAAIYRGADNFKHLAEELGYCDVYHFSKAFRSVMGTPPSKYRRTVRGG